MDYFSARYYDSEIGRTCPDLSGWLNVDPLASKYPGWSPYNYCMNNPLNLVDPDGTWVPEYDKDNNVIKAKYERVVFFKPEAEIESNLKIEDIKILFPDFRGTVKPYSCDTIFVDQYDYDYINYNRSPIDTDKVPIEIKYEY